MKKFLPFLFWTALALVVIVGMALRPTWNDSDYYIQVVNMTAAGLKPHIDYPHIYTLLSTWIMLPLHSLLGPLFSPTSMSVLVGLFHLAVARLTFRMLRRLACPPLAAHAGAALTVFLAISSGHLQFTLEPWCVLFGTLSLSCVIGSDGARRSAVFAGLLAAATFLCKQNGGILLAGVATIAWFHLPQDRRARFLIWFACSAAVAFLAYAVATFLWLGDTSGLAACLGRVRYSRSTGVARGEAIRTLVLALLWSFPVWLSLLATRRTRIREKLVLLFCCLLLVPAVLISPGDHNRYFIAPFLGLLFGICLRDMTHPWPCWLSLVYLAEVGLRCVLYLPEPLREFLDHGSIYSRDDLELVSHLRQTLQPGDRLLVIPKDAAASVARFYVLSHALPATLDIRHHENLGWGTEFIFGDESYRATSVSNATLFAVRRQTEFQTCRQRAIDLGGRPVQSLKNWEILRK